MHVEVYSRLVTSSSRKFIEAYSRDKRKKYDVAPVYRIDTPSGAEIGKSIRDKIKSIINEEMCQNAEMIDKLLELEHEDIYETEPVGEQNTRQVQVGEVYIQDGGVIADIQVDRVFNTFDPSGMQL